MWFQQDDGTCRTARVTMDLLRGTFGENFISLNYLIDNIEAFIREIPPEMLEEYAKIGLSRWTISYRFK